MKRFFGSSSSDKSSKADAPKADAPKTDIPKEPKDSTHIWHRVTERSLKELKGSKVTAAVTVSSGLNAVIGPMKDALAVQQVQTIGKTIIEGIPFVMDALKILSDVHPFVKLAYIPFRHIYELGLLHKENDKKRNILFTKILDVMLVLLELENVRKDDHRMTPAGEPICSRLEQICKDIHDDIEECYTAIEGQEKRWIVVKVAKAGGWNKELGEFAGRFVNKREELKFALSLRAAITVEEINQKMAEKFSKLDDLRDDLVETFKGFFKGSHNELTEEIASRVWKLQGWDKTATTSKLVFGMRTYLIKQSKNGQSETSKRLGTKRQSDGDSKSLVDSWAVIHLENKRMYNFRQALDPEFSGSTSIEELNEFIQSRPEEWSFPRWIAYWSIGWQIFATKYCLEIEGLFSQLLNLKAKVCEENAQCVNDYIATTRPHVITLTSVIERYEGTSLEARFADYVKTQENRLNEQLDKIQFKLDGAETVSDVLDDARIEEVIFILFALLLRRHVAKMRSGVEEILDAKDLRTDAASVVQVVHAVGIRYVDIKEKIQQYQQNTDVKATFDWLSFGLFKNYLDREYILPRHPVDRKLSTGELSENYDSNSSEETLVARRPPTGADPKLWYTFVLIDKDGSGAITPSELQRALLNNNWTPFHRSTVSLLMTVFDNDQSGTIDFHEFAGLWKFIEDWKQVFNHFDSDHSGTIERKELANVLTAEFGWTLSPAVFEQMQPPKTATAPKGDVPAGLPLNTFLRVIVIVKQLSEELGKLDVDHNNVVQIGYEQLVEIVLHLLLKLG
ncbi:hypothetical protein MVEN_01281000 [Mycena venus]|uniref:EF-hand domain-containing protein n=1 Tax=Mycena venus TaxID=2733690 RepID=A0A8H6XY97_9AGAR|nr:hypothetical protein MVEN_01281000 [Mycena venus]